MSSYTYNETFTITHAKQLAAKVATDLKRLQRFYGYPTDSAIDSYEKEVIHFLKNGYLKEVTYGFKKDDKWIEPTLKYTAKELANSGLDDDPGKVRPGADTSGASFYSYMTYTQAYFNITSDERVKFEEGLPFQRTGAAYPDTDGYFSNDRAYYSGGKGLDRSSLKGF
jgi:hypothetical protein